MRELPLWVTQHADGIYHLETPSGIIGYIVLDGDVSEAVADLKRGLILLYNSGGAFQAADIMMRADGLS